MSLAILIMAAGKGTRLKSNRAKVLHEIGGAPLLTHVIHAAASVVKPEEIFVVVGHQAESVEAAVAAMGVRFVEQKEQRGTGHAVQSAAGAITGAENVIVLSGDVPLIRTETIEALFNFHETQKAAMTILSATPADPTGYGRVIRRKGDAAGVEAIVEQKDLAPDELSIGEINSGIYAFSTAALLKQLAHLNTNNAQGELYLTDVAKLLFVAGERVVALEAADANEILGANTIAELAALDQSLRARTARRLMDAGVTIQRPETCVIDAEVEVEADAIIEPFVQLLGKTRIGTETRIRSYTVIENCTIGSGVLVRQNCVLGDSTVEDGAKIGPFAHLRPESHIGVDAHIGNFVETKKSKIGKGAKANHLAYIGDAEVGEATNIGAGTITCNYDGANKHVTRIGKGVFVGSNSTLIAPLTIGDGAYIGAASCIPKDVPADALAVGRAHQMTKEGWAKARREKNPKKK
jgi:bifunctional UDP-N-acetylglucosamine pyrophosphorylase / glucosamine-1-phosphate N-acetyltransferase